MTTDQKTKVLVVEDVKVSQTAAASILQELNCDIDIAGTGKEALAFLQQNQYQLILMDLGLPDIDGLTVTETIRYAQQENEQKPIPIVALTVYADDQFRQYCDAIGMDGFISKPLTLEKGKQMLQRFLR